MNLFVQNFRSVIKSFNRRLTSSALRHRFHIQTAVYGYDNKNTRYQSKICPKWSYGDDACFIADNEDSVVLGVADGVGGWRSYGINPSLFARTFMRICHRTVKAKVVGPENPLLLAKLSYYDILHLKSPTLGSATFCILSMCRSTGHLYAANLGDSGYLVIRNHNLVSQSVQQKHSFNTPFQIALLPTTGQQPRFHEDNPDEAQQSQFQVREGDIVVVGTDGLFDNMTVPMILHEVSLIEDHKYESLFSCAQRLVDRAQRNSVATDFQSPFASEAQSYGINFKGGNPGDITVILGLVVLEQINEEQLSELRFKNAEAYS